MDWHRVLVSFETVSARSFPCSSCPLTSSIISLPKPSLPTYSHPHLRAALSIPHEQPFNLLSLLLLLIIIIFPPSLPLWQIPMMCYVCLLVLTEHTHTQCSVAAVVASCDPAVTNTRRVCSINQTSASAAEANRRDAQCVSLSALAAAFLCVFSFACV